MSLLSLAIAVALWGVWYPYPAGVAQGNLDICGIYCLMALDYSNYLIDRSFDVYYFSKSLISFFAHLAMISLPIEMNPEISNLVLIILNSLCLVSAAWVWFLISNHANFNWKTSFWGFSLICFNQIFFYWTPYYQESPDNVAFLFGLILLYLYISKRYKFILLFFVVNSFVQPQLNFAALALFVFRNTLKKDTQYDHAGYVPVTLLGQREFRVKKGLYFALAVAVFVTFFGLLTSLSLFVYPPYFGTDDIVIPLLPVSIFLQSLILGYAFYRLDALNVLMHALRQMGGRQFWSRLLLCGLVLLLPKLISNYFANGEIASLNSTTLGSLYFAYTFVQQSVSVPMKAIMVHIVFYGFALSLVLLLWDRICVVLRKESVGFAGLIIFALMLSNGTESRHLIAFLPFFVYLLLASGFRLSFPITILVLLLQFANTRFYADPGIPTGAEDTYLMTMGPWISNVQYQYFFIAGAVLIFLGFVVTRFEARE